MTSAPVPPPQPLHLLKFNYDAMTSLVKITLTLHPAPTNKSAEAVAPEQPRVLYSGIHPGGFNQPFALPKEAALDLNMAIVPISPVDEAIEEDKDDDKAGSARRPSEDTSRTSGERGEPPAQPDLEAIPELNRDQPSRQNSVRRFGLFSRRREHDLEAGHIEMTQTASAADAAAAEADAEKEAEEKRKKEEEEHGMRLVIQLDAVGAEGEPLRRRNGQLTHILVSGTWVPDAGSTQHSGTGKRVWVVKVVRREAQIGAHSFLLKEIYGLSSAAGADSTSYPPAAADPYASAPNECIVCLTSPRDVVLLPCRHLVVCRECAVGMVEFGAGGRVARREEEGGADAGGGGGGGAGGPAAGLPTMGMGIGGGLTTPAPVPAPTRRKKKAKGWYCPVCRQPYTSLLRLALPPSKEGGSLTSGQATPAPVGVTTDAEGTGMPHLHRAASVRSVRTTRSTRSVATLPDGAEAMLSRLGPELSDDEDDDMALDERERNRHMNGTPSGERPQFVIAESMTTPSPPNASTPSAPASTTAPGPPVASPTSPGPPVAAPLPSASMPQPPGSYDAAGAPAPANTANTASVTSGVANMRVQ